MPAAHRELNLLPGRKLGPSYVIESRLGTGTEGEVYQVRDTSTGILRAAKIYYPHRDPDRRLVIHHARKLNTLRSCPIVLQYHHSERLRVRGQHLVALISELCEGIQLEQWIAQHRGNRLQPYVALHVLYNLVIGLESIHALGEYHSDVHSQNILVRPTGVRFELKLIDFYDWGKPAPYKQKQDILDAVTVFHECLGGSRAYPALPPEVKYICAGRRSSLILGRFPNMSALRKHLRSFPWATGP